MKTLLLVGFLREERPAVIVCEFLVHWRERGDEGEGKDGVGGLKEQGSCCAYRGVCRSRHGMHVPFALVTAIIHADDAASDADEMKDDDERWSS